MTVSALKKKRRLAMSVARDAKKRMLESDLTPAASEEGERQGEVGEHNSAVAVPTTIQQTWLQHGFIYDEYHCLFVCLKCETPAAVSNPAKHFNEVHRIKTHGNRLDPSMFAQGPVHEFCPDRTVAMKPIVGVKIETGYGCNECGSSYLTRWPCSKCPCPGALVQVRIQRVGIGTGARKTAYRVETDDVPVEELPVSNDSRKKAIADALKRTSVCRSDYIDSTSQLGPFFTALKWFTEDTEFPRYLEIGGKEPFAIPAGWRETDVQWLAAQLKAHWAFANGLGDFGAQSVGWRAISGLSEAKYIRKCRSLIYAAVNLFGWHASYAFDFPASFGRALADFVAHRTPSSLFALIDEFFRHKLEPGRLGFIEVVLRLHCVDVAGKTLKSPAQIQPVTAILLKLSKLATLVLAHFDFAVGSGATSNSLLQLPAAQTDTAAIADVSAEDDEFYDGFFCRSRPCD